MVLGNAMKRLLYVFAGALVFAVIGFVVGSIATNLYSDYLAKSDDDINSSVGMFMVLWGLLVALGAYLGHRLYVTTLRSSVRPPATR
jgi:hypothetical protein